MGKRRTVKEKNEVLAKQGFQLKNYGFVLPVYPTEEQAVLINKTMGCTRFVYNHYLTARQAYYKENGTSLSADRYKKDILVPLKASEDFGFLKEVDKFALEVACESVEDAYSRFFKKQNNYPKLKKKRSAKRAYTTKMTNNNIEIVSTSYIKLPKLGKIEIAKNKTARNKSILKKIAEGQIKIQKATVSQKGSKYYVSLALEEVVPQITPLPVSEIEADKIVGIDLGLKTFAAISNGLDTEFIEKAKYIKEAEKKLAKRQRRLAKKQLDSQNFLKAKYKVADLQMHIANQRKDFAHKLSTQIANENQVVVLEKLNIKGMVKNRKLSKAISDAGWYQFIIFLKYKLEWQGKHLIQIDRWYASSKICSACGEKHIGLTLSDRKWVCSHCEAEHERDENAAINIRNKGLETLGLVSLV
jgi:putative transposase